MRRFFIASAWALALLVAACAPAQPAASTDELSGTILVAGSTTVQPLAEVLAGAFSSRYPQVQIDIQGGGTGVGIKSAGEGTVMVGAASRALKDEEKSAYPDLIVHTIALDGIAIIANPSVPLTGLTKDQVRDIFSGRVSNWQDVGGPDRAIVVVSREAGSGTRSAFEELVLGEGAEMAAQAILQPTNGAVRTTVATTPDAVGYLSLGYLDSSVKALAVDGVAPSEANVVSGAYAIVRPLLLLTRGEPSGAVKAWLDYVLSAEGQQIVAREGYIAAR